MSDVPKAGLFRRLDPRTSASIPFTIDGEPVEAREGDLLLTAILLHRTARVRTGLYPHCLRLRDGFGAGDGAGDCPKPRQCRLTCPN